MVRRNKIKLMKKKLQIKAKNWKEERKNRERGKKWREERRK